MVRTLLVASLACESFRHLCVGAALLFGSGCQVTEFTVRSAISLDALDDVFEVPEDSAGAVLDVLRNDVAERALITRVSGSGHGSVSITSAGLTYVPEPKYCNDYPGALPDYFSYTIDNGVERTSASALVTVTCISDGPKFVVGPDQVLTNQVGGAEVRHAISDWATVIYSGNGHHPMVFVVAAANPGMFMAHDQPAVSPTGELTFTPSIEVVGTTSVALHLVQESGTVSPGDVDRSAVQTFTISTEFPMPQAIDDASVELATVGSQSITVPAARGVLLNDRMFTASVTGYGPFSGSEQRTIGLPASTVHGG